MGSAPIWATLQGDIDGQVVLPRSAGYDEWSRPFNGRFEPVRPQAIARCASAHDVAETLSFLAREQLPVAVRSGGHCFVDHASSPGVIIDVGPMHTVEVASGEVRVGAGARLGPIYEALEPHGITIPGGTCPTVGIAGLTLGGGLGILGRSCGVTSDRLVQAEIVLSDGTTLTCDPGHHADLHWALRGGGAGSFGVVTSLTFDPVPVPGAALNVHAKWSYHQANAVIDAWQHWAPAAPDRLAASLKVTVPAELGQAPQVDLYATLFGDEAEIMRLLTTLDARAGVEPESITVTTVDYRQTRRFWASLGTTETSDANPPTSPPTERLYAKSEFFRRLLPAEVIVQLLTTLMANRAPGQYRELDFMPWGGAYGHKRPDETAFAHRDETFLLKQSISIPRNASPSARAEADRQLGTIWAATHPVGSNRSFQNFADPALHNWASSYYGENYPGLVTVKTRYDPGNTFRHAQSIALRSG
jgi:FAD/FMN-containing dehydrogenase